MNSANICICYFWQSFFACRWWNIFNRRPTKNYLLKARERWEKNLTQKTHETNAYFWMRQTANYQKSVEKSQPGKIFKSLQF